jgi:hypothetical protein
MAWSTIPHFYSGRTLKIPRAGLERSAGPLPLPGLDSGIFKTFHRKKFLLLCTQKITVQSVLARRTILPPHLGRNFKIQTAGQKTVPFPVTFTRTRVRGLWEGH